MALYTPTGLKIRLPVPHAFALMARLEPHVSPFRVLMATEGIELVPNMLRLFVALACFWYQQSFVATFLWCVLATLAGMIVNILGVHRIPGLVRLSTLYSYCNVWELCTIATVLFGIAVAGWQTALAYCLSCAAGWVLGMVEERLEERILGARTPRFCGVPLIGAERSFINAYRYYAGRAGLQDAVHMCEASITDDIDWKGTLVRFDSTWPQVAMHFDYFGND